MLWFESPSQWWIPSKIGVLNSSSLQASLHPSQQRRPSYCKVRLCPSPRIHSGSEEQLVQLLEQPRYWTTNIWLNSLPHPEMRGKVDFTRILDLIFNPTPVNDAMGEVFLLSFFHQCWLSRVSPNQLCTRTPSLLLFPSAWIANSRSWLREMRLLACYPFLGALVSGNPSPIWEDESNPRALTSLGSRIIIILRWPF